jgi:hypothetical protein
MVTITPLFKDRVFTSGILDSKRRKNVNTKTALSWCKNGEEIPSCQFIFHPFSL